MFLAWLANTSFIPNENGELIAGDPSPIPDPIGPIGQVSPLPPGDYGATFVKMILTMVALVALLYVTVWFLRRLMRQRLEKGTGQQSIRVLEKKMISPKTMLYLIEADHKKILIAESHLEVKRLESLSEERSHHKRL